MSDWNPIDTAPRDGTLIQGKEEDLSVPRLALYRCFWKNGRWRQMEYDRTVYPTTWRHNLPEHRT